MCFLVHSAKLLDIAFQSDRLSDISKRAGKVEKCHLAIFHKTNYLKEFIKNCRYKCYNIGLVDHVIFSSNNYLNYVTLSVKWAFIILLSVIIDYPLKKKKILCLASSDLKRPKNKTKLALNPGNKDTSQMIVNLTIGGDSSALNQKDLPGKLSLI